MDRSSQILDPPGVGRAEGARLRSLSDMARTLGRPATLDDVPDAELDRVASMGFDWVWLLSVWRTGEAGQRVSRSNPEWRHEFEATLPDLREEDIGGSGFAITGYTVHADLGGQPYHVLRKGRARAGLLPAPPKGVQPTWLAYVLVKDPAALASRAASLGGKVLLAPRPDVRKGTLAIVADPSGAALALQKWPI